MYNFLKDKTVLYIEDELEVLTNIGTLLSHYFDKVYLAEDGLEGQKILHDKKIDLMLIDIELPTINGIDLIKKIRETNKSIPIIVISAYTNENYLLAAVELNLLKYIVKPLTSDKIKTVLTTLNDYFSECNEIALTSSITISGRESVVIINNNNKLKLTKKELRFLIYLAQKRSIGYDTLQALWKNKPPTKNAIRVFIKKIRQKLPDNTIKTNNDTGYFIEEY